VSAARILRRHPFYNEAANAAALLEEVNATLISLAEPYEVLMVDDGSADQCAEILTGIAAAQPQCKLIRLWPNGGQAAALYRGLIAATAPVIITMDGDGQIARATFRGCCRDWRTPTW